MSANVLKIDTHQIGRSHEVEKVGRRSRGGERRMTGRGEKEGKRGEKEEKRRREGESKINE